MNSNINMYIGCEEAGGGYTTLYNPDGAEGSRRTGTTIRFNLVDDSYFREGLPGHQVPPPPGWGVCV